MPQLDFFFLSLVVSISLFLFLLFFFFFNRYFNFCRKFFFICFKIKNLINLKIFLYLKIKLGFLFDLKRFF